MKSAHENYSKSSLENLQKSLPFRVIYVKHLKLYYFSLPISCKIKSFWYTFDSLVNSRLINKETREHKNVNSRLINKETREHVNMSVWKKWVSEKYLILNAST